MDIYSLDIKHNKWIYLYYLLLHFVCLSWTNIDLVAPSAMLRILVTGAVFLPLIKYFWMAPAVIILFVGLRFNSVAPFGYIPQSWDIYGIMILFVAVLHSFLYKNKSLLHFNKTQILLLFFIYIIDVINFQFYTPILLFVIMLYVLYNSINNQIAFNLTIFSFVLLTITLSIYFIVFAEEFVENYYGEDLERSSWLDPNYFGLVLGCGVILSSACLFRAIRVYLSVSYKIVFIVCIVLGFIVVVLQASRGAVLSVTVALMIQLFFSKTKLSYKIVALIVGLLGLFYMYQLEYFDLLIERVSNDDSGGSGRGKIWENKIITWLEQPIYYLGSGYQGAVSNFKPYKLDCHNEFVSTLLNYGFVGLILLFVFIFKLLSYKFNRSFIWSLVFFILIAFCTLSPITCQTGWTACPLLLVLIYKYIHLNKLNVISAKR